MPDITQFGPDGAVDFQSEENVQVVLLKINLDGLWQVPDNFFSDTTHFTLKSNQTEYEIITNRIKSSILGLKIISLQWIKINLFIIDLI